MSFIQGLVLGAIQGITEWLPISSEGITTLVMVNFFDLPFADALFLAIWLHLGTVLAAIFYFRHELYEIVRCLPGYVRDIRHANDSAQGKLVTFLLLGTIVTAAIGGPLVLFSLSNLNISSSLLTALIGVFLIITGLTQRFALRTKSADNKHLRIRDGLFVGIAQALSVFPGFSRSGLSVSALLFLRYNGEQALRLSFLLSIPLVLIAQVGLGIVKGITINEASVAGLLSSVVFGFLTIKALMKFALAVPFWAFCVVLGLLSLVPLLLGFWGV